MTKKQLAFFHKPRTMAEVMKDLCDWEKANPAPNPIDTGGEKELFTKGELWLDDDGFIAVGTGDEYKTFADLDCSSDMDIDEREANKERLVKVWNCHDELVNTLKSFRGLEPWIGDREMQKMFHDKLESALSKAITPTT